MYTPIYATPELCPVNMKSLRGGFYLLELVKHVVLVKGGGRKLLVIVLLAYNDDEADMYHLKMPAKKCSPCIIIMIKLCS